MDTDSKIKLLHTLKGHGDRVWHCSWSPDGNLLATCSGDRTTRIWAKRHGKWELAQILKDHDRTVRRVAFSPHQGSNSTLLLATGSFDSTTSIYELQDGKFVLSQTLEGHDNEVKGVAWDCSGELLATCSRDKSVWIYMQTEGRLDCISVGQSHTQDVKSVIWHPTQELLLSCSYDDTLKVWQDDEDDWVCTETIKGHSSTIWDAVFEPKEGLFMASVSEDRSLVVWKFTNPESMPASGDEITRFVKFASDSTSHPRTIYSVDWSKQPSSLLITGCADDAIRIFSLQDKDNDTNGSLRLEETFTKAHGNDINCVRWHPKETIFASCGDDGIVRIWSYDA